MKMKTVLAILALATIAGFFGTGAFVTQTPDTVEGLIVLNDEALTQKVGGRETSVRVIDGHGDKAACSVNSCDPDPEFFWTNPKYDCVECEDTNDNAYEMINEPAVIKSYCQVFERPNGKAGCRTISEVMHSWDTCNDYIGACGT